MLLYAVTIFVSAFLLFLVQPVMAKQILPWFGGSATVWTTCLVFFQSTLTAGYAYADWTVHRLAPRRSVQLHVAVARAQPPASCRSCRRPLEARRRREPVVADPRHAGGHDRAPLFPAVDDESARAGLVRAALPGRQPVSPVRAVEPGVDARAARLPVPARAVGRDPRPGAGAGRLATCCSSRCAQRRMAQPRARRRRARARRWRSDARDSPPPHESFASAPTAARQLLWCTLAATASILLLAVSNHITQNIAVGAAAVDRAARAVPADVHPHVSTAPAGTSATSCCRWPRRRSA